MNVLRFRTHCFHGTWCSGDNAFFSAYCRTGAIGTATAGLKVKDEQGNFYYSNKITGATSGAFDNGWERLEVTFTLPHKELETITVADPETGKDRKITREIPQTVTVYLETDSGSVWGTGKVFFDCVQLEEGNTANDYNILEDGSFELTDRLLPYKAENIPGRWQWQIRKIWTRWWREDTATTSPASPEWKNSCVSGPIWETAKMPMC